MQCIARVSGYTFKGDQSKLKVLASLLKLRLVLSDGLDIVDRFFTSFRREIT